MARTQDALAWTEDEDLALVEIVLRYIRTGKTIKEAFVEAEKVIPNRTAAACRNQWAKTLRRKYDASIEQAKMQSIFHEEKEFTKAIQSNREETLENGGDQMTPEIVLPKNRSINKMSDAMDKALKETKKKRVGTTSIKVEDELPVTTGIQQEIDFDRNAITDATEEDPKENPFLKIRAFVKKMEKEYFSEIESKNVLLKDINKLKSMLNDSRNELSVEQGKVLQLESDLNQANDKIAELEKELSSYSEIKDLIKQFVATNQ